MGAFLLGMALLLGTISYLKKKQWPGAEILTKNELTHLPLVPHICVSELVSIRSGNGLSPIRRQAII